MVYSSEVTARADSRRRAPGRIEAVARASGDLGFQTRLDQERRVAKRLHNEFAQVIQVLMAHVEERDKGILVLPAALLRDWQHIAQTSFDALDWLTQEQYVEQARRVLDAVIED